MSTGGLDAATKGMVLVACILGTTVVTVDSTAINVALPAIAEDLGGGLAGQQWTANAYLLTLSSLLLIGGSLGDVIGERRVFVAGAAGFGVTSVLCALAAVRAALGQLEGRPFAIERPPGLDPATTARLVRAQEEASVDSFHVGVGIAVVLVGLGGLLGFEGIRNPRRTDAAEGCAGGQLVDVPEDASRRSPCDWHRDLPVVQLPPREQTV